MLLARITTLILFSALMISCGAPEGDNASGPIKRIVSKLETSTNVKFDCADEAECTNSFVLAINSAGDFPKYCTGYMASSTEMVVPSNCLEAATCSTIAAKTVGGKVVKCANIKQLESDSRAAEAYNGEFSVVELEDGIDGDFAPISDARMTEYNYYRLWYVAKKHDNTGYTLEHTRYNCRRTRNNILFPTNNDDASVVAMTNCNIRNISHGAVVVDSISGDVLGLVHDEITEDITFRRFMRGRKGSTLTLATPIKCALKKFNMHNISYDETSYCDTPVFRPGTSDFSQELSGLFRFSSSRNISHVFSRLSALNDGSYQYREFYALEYEFNYYGRPIIKICKFTPSIRPTYEFYYGTSAINCSDTFVEVKFGTTNQGRTFTIYDDYGNVALNVLYKKF